MKTGIIVFSNTGNTKQVAQKLAEKVRSTGALADVKEIKVAGGYDPEKGYNSFTLAETPDPTQFETLVFAAPVMAFSLCPVMKSYLKQINSMSGLKCSLLVTQHLKFKWMGGNRAVRQMKKILNKKGAAVDGSAIVHWSAPNREEQIEAAVQKLSASL